MLLDRQGETMEGGGGSEHPGVPDYQKTKHRVLTRRGVLWLGQTCNLRCHFCYFLDRISKKDHPEHPFMSLDKAKQICRTLVESYGNCAVDIQGGEPMIYPDIYELVTYCRTIGLRPTLITNALVLDNYNKCQKLKDAGVRDLLISVHGMGDTYDKIVGVPGAHNRQMNALENLQKIGIPFRFNCVLSREALSQINEISRLAINTNARVVNFIAFNPFEDQQRSGKRSSDNVPMYSEISPCLNEALDILDNAGIECNVRYIPFCIVDERHWKSIYNFQQLSYDIHEWDYASWSWTGLKPQRMKDGELSPTVSLREITFRSILYNGFLNPLAKGIRVVVQKYPSLQNLFSIANRKISRAVNPVPVMSSPADLYRENGRLRASLYCKYKYANECSRCMAKQICDGFHGDYACIFGTEEAKPICGEQPIIEPVYFISTQAKVVEHEDYEWAL